MERFVHSPSLKSNRTESGISRQKTLAMKSAPSSRQVKGQELPLYSRTNCSPLNVTEMIP